MVNFEEELDPFTNAEKLLAEWQEYLVASERAVAVAKKEIEHWAGVVALGAENGEGA